MANPVYTAEAYVTGGRDGRGHTADHSLEVELSRPTEMGGDGEGVNPEQLFALGYSACFIGAIKHVAQQKKLEVADVSIDSKVKLMLVEGPGLELAVELDIQIPNLEDQDALDLVRAAHQVCPYSKATRGNIEVHLVVNGHAVIDQTVNC